MKRFYFVLLITFKNVSTRGNAGFGRFIDVPYTNYTNGKLMAYEMREFEDIAQRTPNKRLSSLVHGFTDLKPWFFKNMQWSGNLCKRHYAGTNARTD